jgi:hypothetical protein
MTQTMTTQELAKWLNNAASYMAALASYPIPGSEESRGEDYVAEVKECNALTNAALSLQDAATQLIHLRVNGVQQEIILVSTQGVTA